MNIQELYIHPILEIYATAELTGPPGPIIANFNQMLLMVANDNTKQSKDLLVPRFNKIVAHFQKLSDTCKTTPQSCAMTPQNKQKYYQQLTDYKKRMDVIIKTPDTKTKDPRIGNETEDIARSSGNPLLYRNYDLARQAADAAK
jgi:hypothetical protein